jgi:hypothetical protein
MDEGYFVDPKEVARLAEAAIAADDKLRQATWSGPSNLRDLSLENKPTDYTDDDQVRDWVTRSDRADLAALATPTKVKLVNTLTDGWIADQDLSAVEAICRTARPGAQSDALRAALGARLDGMWSGDQHSRLQAAINDLR